MGPPRPGSIGLASARGLKIALTISLSLLTVGLYTSAEEPAVKPIFDFSTDAPWPSIDDGVMGGVSRSAMAIENGVAVFSGVLSLENNGGFASVRSRPADHDLSGFRGLVVRVKGDGHRYKLRLRTSASFDGVSYEAPLEPQSADWEDVAVAFDALRPVYRGRLVPDYPALDPASVKTFGIMIADSQEGPFRLEIASISGTR